MFLENFLCWVSFQTRQKKDENCEIHTLNLPGSIEKANWCLGPLG
jgi:hypothetical protein